MRKSFLMILLIACALLAQAQTRQQMGGVYYAYPAPKKPVSVKAPEGYTPFTSVITAGTALVGYQVIVVIFG